MSRRGAATLVWVAVTVATVGVLSAVGRPHWIVPAVAVAVLVGLWLGGRAGPDWRSMSDQELAAAREAARREHARRKKEERP